MGRRANGEGSVYPIRDKATGKVVAFGGSITLGWRDGKRLRKKIERKTRREVMDALEELKRQHESGVDLTERPQLVAAYLLDWLHHTFALESKGKSVETYEKLLNLYILPSTGGMTVQKVKARDARRLKADLQRRGLSHSTINSALAVGRSGFRQAVEDGLLDANPFDGIKRMKREKSPAQAITADQARALLAAIRPLRLGVAIQLALSLGLRIGEVCGLRRENIDLKAGILIVRGTLQWIAGQGLVWDSPKSDAGERSIKLPKALLAAVDWHIKRLDKERAAMEWGDNGYVFVASRSGGPLNPCTLRTIFKAAARDAGLPESLRFHDLRHSCASFLHAQRVPIKTISVILGHADTRITNDLYVHLFADEISDAAESVEELFEQVS
jgi:integrase